MVGRGETGGLEGWGKEESYLRVSHESVCLLLPLLCHRKTHLPQIFLKKPLPPCCCCCGGC